MRILIIGGTGFIGAHVTHHLLAAGHDVAVFHRGETPLGGALTRVGEINDESHDESLVREILGERAQLSAARDEVVSFSPDVAVHMILGTAQDAWTARTVLEDLVDHVVVVSSMDVYRAYGILRGTEPHVGGGELDLDDETAAERASARSTGGDVGYQPVPIPVDGELRRNLYPYRFGELSHVDRESLSPERRRRLEDYDKIPVEAIFCASPTLRTTTLRLPMVHGPGDPQHRLHDVLKRMDDGRPAILVDEVRAGWRTMRGDVDDVGRAIAHAALAGHTHQIDPAGPVESGDDADRDRAAMGTRRDGGSSASRRRVFNVGDPNVLTERAWIQAIADVAGWDGELVELPQHELPEHLQSPYDFHQDLVVDVSATPEALGLPAPTPLATSLERTIAWARANPPEEVDEADFDYEAEDRAMSKQ